MILDQLCTIGNGVEVRQSGIPNAGFGLFACKDFQKNEYITLYDGETMTRATAWKQKCVSHMATKEGITVDGLKVPIIGRGGGSFANSSMSVRTANAEICAWLGYLLIKSKQSIMKGEEIKVFYGRRGFQISCMENVNFSKT